MRRWNSNPNPNPNLGAEKDKDDVAESGTGIRDGNKEEGDAGGGREIASKLGDEDDDFTASLPSSSSSTSPSFEVTIVVKGCK